MAQRVPINMRERALEAIEHGQTKESVAIAYGVTERTLRNWASKKRTTGSCEDKHRQPCDEKRKVSDETIREYLAKNPDAYYDEMSHDLGITKSYLWRRVQSMKITRKKNFNLRGKRSAGVSAI